MDFSECLQLERQFFKNCRTPPFLVVLCLVPLFSAVFLTPSPPQPPVTSALLSPLYNFHLCKPKFYKHPRTAAQTSVSFSHSRFFSPSINLTHSFRDCLNRLCPELALLMIQEIQEDQVEMVIIYLEVNLLSICKSNVNAQKLPKETSFFPVSPFHSFHIRAGHGPKEHSASPMVFWGRAVMVRCAEDTQRWWIGSKGANNLEIWYGSLSPTVLPKICILWWTWWGGGGLVMVGGWGWGCASPRILGCKWVE